MRGGKLAPVIAGALVLGGAGAATVIVAGQRGSAPEGPLPAAAAPPAAPAPAVPEAGPADAAGEPWPVPVLLVPGWLDTGRDMAALRIRLTSSGWPDAHVATLTFEERTGSNRDHAREIAAAVDALLARTGAPEVDVVAHSMGGLATRWYLMAHPDAPVRRVVFMASPHRGTLSAHLAWGGGREEMLPDSPFLDTLNAAAPVPVGVDAITIRTTVDTHIVPAESATLPGVVDHVLCCPTHAGLLHDEETFTIVREFLEDGAGR